MPNPTAAMKALLDRLGITDAGQLYNKAEPKALQETNRQIALALASVESAERNLRGSLNAAKAAAESETRSLEQGSFPSSWVEHHGKRITEARREIGAAVQRINELNGIRTLLR